MDVNVTNKNSLKIGAIAFSCLILVGCGTIQKPTSSYSLQRFATPEIASEALSGSAYIGYAQMHKVVLPDSANGKPSFDCNPTILCVEEDPYFVQGSLAVMPGLEFSFNSQLNRIGATWQFYGDYRGNAKTGNISQALVFGVSSHSESDTDVGNFEIEVPSEFTKQSWDQTTKTIDIGWVGGYRIDEQWLVYGGPFITYHDIDNTVEIKTDLSKIQNRYDFKGRQVGANIAMQYTGFSWLDINLELVSARYSMNNGSINDSQINMMLGTRF